MIKADSSKAWMKRKRKTVSGDWWLLSAIWGSEKCKEEEFCLYGNMSPQMGEWQVNQLRTTSLCGCVLLLYTEAMHNTEIKQYKVQKHSKVIKFISSLLRIREGKVGKEDVEQLSLCSVS
jgi:hypothetical protein